MTQTTDVDFTAQALLVGIELSSSVWRLAISDQELTKVSEADVEPGDWAKLAAILSRAKEKLGLADEAQVVSCYEAGRDGFWVHRFLSKLGVVNRVIDSSSILVDRRFRRAKTDSLDSRQMLEQLARWVVSGGKAKVGKVVRVPSVEEEDARRLHRERERLVGERGAHQVRIKALLALTGTRVKDARAGEISDLRQWDGAPLPPELRGELEREQERLLLVDEQLRQLEKERAGRLKSAKPGAKRSAVPDDTNLTTAQKQGIEKARTLGRLTGIGPTSAWLLSFELFWRDYDNRRQVGCASGLVPTPYNSGSSNREQGISKAGNPVVRKVLIELAWSWLRFQPQSQLAKWFGQRFGPGGSRSRRIGIVAVARRLVVDLWRFVKYGVVPEGAVLRREQPAE